MSYLEAVDLGGVFSCENTPEGPAQTLKSSFLQV